MKKTLRLAASFVLLAGVAGCDSIGEGSTVERLTLVGTTSEFEHGLMVPATETDPRFYKMYDCFCSNLAVTARFTDGTLSNFNYRAKFTSDNPNVVQVLTTGVTDDICPGSQRIPGLLIPKAVGTAVITAEFAGLSDSVEVRVTDTALAGADITLEPAVAPAEVAVGASLSLLLRGTFDGRLQTLNRNATEWTLAPADTNIASINSIGVVTGYGRSGASPVTATAAFPTCSLTAQAPVYVGDILGPLTVDREAPDFATDGQLAVNSDEFMTVTAALDFDGDSVADGSQSLGSASVLSYTDTCTLREYDADNATTHCKENVTDACTNLTPVCTSATPTSCSETMTPCRKDAAPIGLAAASRIIAFSEAATPTLLSARYPAFLGRATTLAADVTADATTITVAELVNYPSTETRWYGVIDKDGQREDVIVTGYSGTTLTVVRGAAGGGPAVAHASGASFEQRSFTSDQAAALPITPKAGTLASIEIDTPGTLEPQSQLQLHAFGTFVDESDVAREQRVTRLNSFASGSPALGWLSSDLTVARFSNSSPGLLISTSPCGGTVSVRARTTTSESTIDGTFDETTTDDDVACEDVDPLCDQVEICVARQSPLPANAVCEDPAPVCP